MLAWPSGMLRVVREAVYKKDRLLSISLSIKACSWTRRSYTVYCRSDLNTVGARPIGIRVNLHSRLDRLLLKDIQDKTRHFTCHQVKTLP